MATSNFTLLLAFSLLAISAAARPCKTLFFITSTSYYHIPTTTTSQNPNPNFILPNPSISPRFLTFSFSSISFRDGSSKFGLNRPLIFFRRSDPMLIRGPDPIFYYRDDAVEEVEEELESRSSLSMMIPVEFYSSVTSSVRDRSKDIMRVVGALLFGVGCGVLTAATMYLIWSLFWPNRFDYEDSEDDSDDDVSPKKMGYVAIPTKVVDGELKKAAAPAKEDTELDQTKGAQLIPAERTKDQTEIQKGEQNRLGGKNGKQGSHSADPPKEEYIHIRARRGQATNSHSLAERVRREKISEGMKYLQDLVPGCNKVTGKAVILDEIINYVQSLQRQVEILHSRMVPSSSLAFAPDMTMPYHSLQQLQSGLLQSGLPGLGNSTDALLRSIYPHLSATGGDYKESSSQLPNIWDDELHNVVEMGLSTSAPLHSQNLSGPSLSSQMKEES